MFHAGKSAKFCSKYMGPVFPPAITFLYAANSTKAKIIWATDPVKEIHLTWLVFRENNTARAVSNGITISNKRFIRFYFQTYMNNTANPITPAKK